MKRLFDFEFVIASCSHSLFIGGLLLLGGCAATSHPDYEPVFQKQSVPAQQVQEILKRFRSQGIAAGQIGIDPLGRVQLTGAYDDEKQVERAFVIAREVVGENAVSRVRPEAIKLKDWEISANKGFAKFIEDLAKKFKMSVHLEQKDAENQIAVSHMGLDGVTQFASGSSEPTQTTAQFYKQMASRIAESAAEKSGKKRILIVGHTDDTGDSESNASLAERRARSIGKIFEATNISGNRIFYQGAGEVFPIGDNRTEEGRAKNRRVEIVDLSDEQKFAEFLAARKPNIAFYRPATPPAIPSTKPAREIATQTKSKPTTPVSVAKETQEHRPTTDSEDRKPTVIIKKETGASPPAFSVDFGGTLTKGEYRTVDIGKVVEQKSFFNIISTATAADSVISRSCAQDRPRISSDVKNLASDKSLGYQLGDYMPGAGSYTWKDMVNGHMIGITKLAVLRDGRLAVTDPQIHIFSKYD
jgi:outer membrane protein OmpA-like peptidoglycan-associated protein